MRERLLEQVRARLERFQVDRNPATVLDPEAVAEMTALLDTVPDPAEDLEIARMAGWLHWARYLVLESGEDQEDLAAALALFAPVYQARPDAVPDEVRTFFGDQRPDAASSAQAWSARAVALLRETMRSGDRATLNDAIDLFRQAVDATPTDHPDRAMYLSNLGLALQARFERVGELADLNDTIDLFRQTVDATPTDHPNRARYLSDLRSEPRRV
ncbi:hypothetical protein [Pseudofrankia sp. BMG5.37]|uniref:hypothetical protein n=1 Tax=Pseudofrankia sp. BMG5.37 TaxID=3050035 RepID=UPI002894882E|nr:hypothetical protein [Pseudofrankia sp. BMG5.37]MDT3442683.1 hypothetical protein [Pseudofrankia sp. BMG5.37]